MLEIRCFLQPGLGRLFGKLSGYRLPPVPNRVRIRLFAYCGLARGPFEHPVGVFASCPRRAGHRISAVPKWFSHNLIRCETTVLGVPCLTLRDNTERPETIMIGTNELLDRSEQAVSGPGAIDGGQ